jgi:hypothetical protein
MPGIRPGMTNFEFFDSRLTSDPNHLPILRRPVPPGGAYRDRHGRWVRDAVDAAASSRAAIAGRVFFGFVSERPARGRTMLPADGKAVWSWHPLLVSSRRRFCSALPGLTKSSIRRRR